MKKTLALACFALLAFPLLASAKDLTAEELKVYQAAKGEPSIATTYNETLAALKGEPNAENADQWRAFLTGYLQSKQQVNPKKASETAKKIGDKCDNGELFDGSKCPDPALVVPGKKGKDGKTGKDVKEQKPDPTKDGSTINTDNRAKANLTTVGAPPHGDTPVTPEEKKDPNKWNSTIAGGKMAIWAALIGFVFGGPVGMMMAAMVGFGAGYFIHKMS